jgi:DNA-binding NarL/FixJ family response regulator
MSGQHIRVLSVDEHALLREGMAVMIRQQSDMAPAAPAYLNWCYSVRP